MICTSPCQREAVEAGYVHSGGLGLKEEEEARESDRMLRCSFHVGGPMSVLL